MIKKNAIAIFFLLQIFTAHVRAQVIELSALVNDVKEYISVYFPETYPFSATVTDTGYVVILEDFTKIILDKSFKPKIVDCKESTIYTSVPIGLIGFETVNQIEKSFPQRRIVTLQYGSKNNTAILNSGEVIKFKKGKILK